MSDTAPAAGQDLLRERLEAAIAALIALLDEIDGDPDLEPDVAEEDDPPEDGGDREPSLGSIEFYPVREECYQEAWSQERWGVGDRSEREDDAGDNPEYDLNDWGI